MYLYILYILYIEYMKRTKIGEGAYGCVHKPSIHCSHPPSINFNYNEYVSKIMKDKNALTELKEFVVIKKYDKNDEYHLGTPILCDPSINNEQVKKDVSKCRYIKINDETFKIRFITWIWQEICVPGDTCQSGFRALSFKNNTKNGDVNSFNINYNKGGVTQISLVLQKISARNYNLTLTYGTTTIKCIATDVDNGHRARVDGDYTGYNYGGRKTRRNKKRRHKTARKRRSYRSKIYY
jgi:hypothetical protein